MKTKTNTTLFTKLGSTSSTATTWLKLSDSGSTIPSSLKSRDVITYNSPSKRDKYGMPLSNYCTHSSIDRPCHLLDAAMTTMGDCYYGIVATSPTSWVWLNTHPSSFPNDYSYYPHTVGSVSSIITENDFRNAAAVQVLEAYQALKLDFSRSGIPNLIQSTLELKDLPQTAMQAAKALLSLKKAMWNGKPSSKEILDKTFGNLTLGDIASAKLWWDYGVNPTIKDWHQVWSKLLRGQFQLVRNIPRDNRYLRIGWTLPFYDERDGNLTPSGAWAPSQASSNVSGNTLWNNMSHETGNTNLVTRDLIQVASPYINAQLDMIPLIGRQWHASGFVYGRMRQTLVGQVPNVEKFDKALIQHGSSRAVWEVIPLSFVIDWFFNIGQWISLLERNEAARQVELDLVEGVWYTQKCKVSSYVRTLDATHFCPQAGTNSTYGCVQWKLVPRWAHFQDSTEFLRARYTPGLVAPRRMKSFSKLYVPAAITLLVASFCRLR